jgi:hypothetical protein
VDASNCTSDHRLVKNSTDDKRGSLVMNRRRWTAYFALPFALVLLLGGFLSAGMAYEAFDGNLGIGIAGVCLFSALCVGIPVGRSAWIALTDKEPALIVDSRGITDNFHLHAFLPWSDMKSARVEFGGGDCLSIVLRDGATAPGGKPVGPSLTRTLKRAWTGSDLTIPLGSLSYNPNRLRALLTHYTQVRR